MIVVQHITQQVRFGKWAELDVLEKKIREVEKRCGFPAPRRYRCLFGGEGTSTLIIERQWESQAAMEAAYEKALADPDWQALGSEANDIIASDRHELYLALP